MIVGRRSGRGKKEKKNAISCERILLHNGRSLIYIPWLASLHRSSRIRIQSLGMNFVSSFCYLVAHWSDQFVACACLAKHLLANANDLTRAVCSMTSPNRMWFSQTARVRSFAFARGRTIAKSWGILESRVNKNIVCLLEFRREQDRDATYKIDWYCSAESRNTTNHHPKGETSVWYRWLALNLRKKRNKRSTSTREDLNICCKWQH
jgi:hypothetical protein